MNIGKTIRTLRLARNVRRNAFAKMVGISDNALGSIEFGRSTPKKATLDKICKLLDISETHLLLLSVTEEDVDKYCWILNVRPLQEYIMSLLPLRYEPSADTDR